MKRGMLLILAVAAISLVALAACASPSQPAPSPAATPSAEPSDESREQYNKAPDFEAIDSQGKTISLSDYIGRKHVVMVINRGFG